MKATLAPARAVPGKPAACWPWAAALFEVAVIGSATVAAGAVLMTGCVGSVCAPVMAGGAAFVAGFVIATVHWRAWARDRLDHALRDPLTGLPTRRVIEDRLDAATRAGEAVVVALADVDGLHAVNATLGHAAGDRYLTAVAYRLARAVPPGGCLVRQGGDEFTLLAPGSDADGLAAAMGAAMGGPAVIAGHRMQPRASVGIAVSNGSDARQARARADAAMYDAKEAGGNRIQVWDPDRHGEPAADGTRPPQRRRDLDPLSAAGVAWHADPGEDVLSMALPRRDARLVHQALVRARGTGGSDLRAEYARLAAQLNQHLDLGAAGPAD